jgi:hypothetical protein
MITGHCECNSVRFEADSAITDYSHCHCSQCRRLHGAAFATFAGVARDKFRYLSGESDLSVYASSDNHDRVFCKVCGSNIMVELSDYPDEVYLSMSVIDGDPPRPPGYHIYVGSKAPWYEINDALTQYHEGVPD